MGSLIRGDTKQVKAPNLRNEILGSQAVAKNASANATGQMDWAKQQWEKQSALSDTVTNMSLDQATGMWINAEEGRARYGEQFQPLEGSLVADANSYASPERRQMESGRAIVDVKSAYDAERENAQKQLEAYGIDPSQTRSQALDLSARVQQAAAEASAGTMAGERVDAVARDLRGQAIDLGQNVADRATQEATTASGIANNTVASQNNTVLAGASTMGTGMDWSGISLNANEAAAGIKQQDWKNKQWAEQNKPKGAIDRLVDASNQTDITGLSSNITNSARGYEDGGEVDVKAPVTPPGATDTVPTMLTPGEYVIPVEVVNHLGVKFFDRLKEKALAEVEGKRAIPAPSKDGRQALYVGGVAEPQQNLQMSPTPQLNMTTTQGIPVSQPAAPQMSLTPQAQAWENERARASAVGQQQGLTEKPAISVGNVAKGVSAIPSPGNVQQVGAGPTQQPGAGNRNVGSMGTPKATVGPEKEDVLGNIGEIAKLAVMFI